MQTGSMNIHNHDTITVSSTWRQCGAQKKAARFLRLILCTFLFFLLCVLVGCDDPRTTKFSGGTYVRPDLDPMDSPYFNFSTEDHSWMSSSLPVTDFALLGSYELKGDTIYAEDSTKQVIIVFQIGEDGSLTIARCKSLYKGIHPWFTKGDVYVPFIVQDEAADDDDRDDVLYDEPEVLETMDDPEFPEEMTEDSGAETEGKDVSEDTVSSDVTDDNTEAEAADASTDAGGVQTAAGDKTIGPTVAEGPVKDMIRKGLTYVQSGCGYSLQDRQGVNGSFDCSGLVAVLLRDSFGCTNYGWDGNNPWDTAWWRSLGSYLNIGDKVQFGSQPYVVTMKDTEDYQAAWSVPGSIVVQYSPTNHPEKTMGHISVALGNIDYTDIQQVVTYLNEEYGVLLDSTTVTGLPMVYDPYGPAAGHTVFKINANGVANCVIVDNNYASDPEWIEPVSLVFTPAD